MIDNESLFYYMGEFVASALIEKGFLHPDMQLQNIGYRGNGQFAFVDCADAIQIKIPEDLTTDNIRRLTESLFPLIGDIKTFSGISYLRTGFVSRAGLLGREIFLNTCNNGFSSFSYVTDDSVELSYNMLDLKSSMLIKEWVNGGYDKVKLGAFPTLESYEQSGIRLKTSMPNRYFLDYLYLIRSYIYFSSMDNDMSSQKATIIMNLAVSALRNNHPITAYGLFQRYLGTSSQTTKEYALCTELKEQAAEIGSIGQNMKEFIEDCQELHLIELLWVLEDLDRLVPHDAGLHVRGSRMG